MVHMLSLAALSHRVLYPSFSFLIFQYIFPLNLPSKLETYISAFLDMCSFSTQKSPWSFVLGFSGILERKIWFLFKNITFFLRFLLCWFAYFSILFFSTPRTPVSSLNCPTFFPPCTSALAVGEEEHHSKGGNQEALGPRKGTQTEYERS